MKMHRRRLAFPLSLFILLLAGCNSTRNTGSSSEPVLTWPTEGWATATAAEVSLDRAPFDKLDQDIRNGEYGHIDRMVVIRDAKMVVNQRYPNNYEDISRGRTSPIGCGTDACTGVITDDNPYNYLHPTTHPYYKGRDVHSLQSVTKSVAATAIGIAITRGEITGLDAPLLSFFDDYDLSNVDDRLRQATLEDLLTMRSGIEWHEQDRPLDGTNTTIELERSEDWIQFTLDQPSDAAPRDKWAYNSGGSHLMSGIIKKATGIYIDDYAAEYLFKPLGIDDFHWKSTPRGYPDTEGGLYLEAEQLAKIGLLYLQKGRWETEQILDPIYASAAIVEQVENVDGRGRGYGYQWWRVDRDDTEVWAGLGFGGQFLFVIPEYQMVGVVNSWNLFGQTQKFIQRDFLTALLDAAAEMKINVTGVAR